MRGNLQTRIAKMEAGQCDALMLAYAGVHRMEYHALIVHEFSAQQMIPAVGQGCIAVEALRELDDEKREKVQSLVNDAATATQLRGRTSLPEDVARRMQHSCVCPGAARDGTLATRGRSGESERTGTGDRSGARGGSSCRTARRATGSANFRPRWSTNSRRHSPVVRTVTTGSINFFNH